MNRETRDIPMSKPDLMRMNGPGSGNMSRETRVMLFRASACLGDGNRPLYTRDRKAEARRECWRQLRSWPLTLFYFLIAVVFAGMLWVAWLT